MVESNDAGLAPVRGKARIDVLDILRGIAILGIFYINVPYMAAPVWQFSADIRSLGWSAADRDAWALINVLLAGTQRCLLEFLFAAGMMVLARKAMAPEGPIAVADLYWRRNLWLLGFGLFDVFVLLWPGDILHIYALAALFLFPFRTLGPRVLLALGLGWAVLCAAGIPEHGLRQYADRAELVRQVDAAHAHLRARQALTQADGKALEDWGRLVAARKPDAELKSRIEQEIKAHQTGFLPYAREAWSYWAFLADEWLVWDVIEAFCTMLIGVALWKWGVIQGQRSKRFYVVVMLAAYGFGIAARAIGVSEAISSTLMPRTSWVTGEFARLAVGLGHLALVNYAVQTRLGNALLSVFKAPGRMAFSLYFLQQFVGKYILFAPFGFNLWGRYGWAQMAAISTMGIVLLILFAHVWMRRFTSGPLEWLWRSLAYVKWQPLLRAALSAPPQPDRSPPVLPASGAAPPAAR